MAEAVALTAATRQPAVLGWAAGYRREWVRADVVAGLTAAAVVIPKALAYATVAGLPVVMGLGTAFIPATLYALFGSSRALSVSTTSAIAIMAATALAATGITDPARLAAAAVVLAALVGGVLLVAGVLRLGFLGNFISDPVLTGFKAGIALVIIVDQLPKLFGLHLGRAPFFEKLGAFAAHLPETHGPTFLVALATIGILLALEHGAPRVPAPLVAVVVAIAASGLLDLSRAGVDVVGTIPSGLPVPAIPDLGLASILWPGALGIALMAFTETVAAGRTFARPEDPRPSADRELVALGLANLGGSLFGSMPAGGGTSQTAVNVKAGARTQLAGLVTVAMVAATLLFLAPLVGLMPQAVLAAIVVVTTMGLLSPAEFRAIAAVRGAEFRWALVALAGVVLLGTLNGILLAVVFSVLALMRQANHPPVYALRHKSGTDIFRPSSDAHPNDEPIPGMLIVRAEGRMTFASAPRAEEHIWALVRAEQPRVLLLDCSAIPDFEYTALRLLGNLERDLGSHGVALWLAALNPEALRVIERSGLARTLGRERMYVTVEHAVAAHLASAGPDGGGRT